METKKKKNAADRRRMWMRILGGDVLLSDAIRRQFPLLVLILVFIIIYISNRYSYQRDLLELDKLSEELIDVKYDALTRSSELMEQSRQSKIEEYIEAKDSELEIASSPPYVIRR